MLLCQKAMGDERKDRWQEVEPWPETVDPKLLLDTLTQVLRRVVVLPKWGPEILALWIVHTYAFLLRNVSTGRGALDVALGEGLDALTVGRRAMDLRYSNIGDYAGKSSGSTRARR